MSIADQSSSPPNQIGQSVMAWEQNVVIPTYEVAEPCKYPMFFHNRVYQGSSGKVYPIPFIEEIKYEKKNKNYRGIWLENEYVRLLILPEIGGRIHLAQDKTNNDYDIFYRQEVIKPALVGLTGPWISGGVEFNWPQHHRPSTFMPVDAIITPGPKGEKTVWLSEHDPMLRLKGMVGISLEPGRSNIYTKARLYNRTPNTHTFLWWANVAAKVHDNYQSFFPTDVTYIADHAVRAVSNFPNANGTYYGIDYSNNPEGHTDISWYKNIPVPTSYMVTHTNYDFFGGYDHDANGGFVHIANRHISPGKKQWTWGNHSFGRAWDRQLTDSGDPYIELMAGVYTDNQPDFSYIEPFETKTFTQCWWPLQNIGPAVNANNDFALALKKCDSQIILGVASTTTYKNMTVTLTCEECELLRKNCDLAPGDTFRQTLNSPDNTPWHTLRLAVTDDHNREQIAFQPANQSSLEDTPIKIATEPPQPKNIASNEELYLTGEHLAQYRHPTRSPEAYWREALRRDTDDIRCNTAMGEVMLERSDYEQAESYLRRAVNRLTFRHPNPVNGKSHYLLGLALRALGRMDEAYATIYKSTWNHAQRSPGHTILAEIDGQRGNWSQTFEHAKIAYACDSGNSRAAHIMIGAMRKLGKTLDAITLSEKLLNQDPLDHAARWELSLCHTAMKCPQIADSTLQQMIILCQCDGQVILDLAFDAINYGMLHECSNLLKIFIKLAPEPAQVESTRKTAAISPIHYYLLAQIEKQLSNTESEIYFYSQAISASPDYCFPSRNQERLLLEDSLKRHPRDAQAHYYLGNYLYNHNRRKLAIDHWKCAIKIDPNLFLAWRNLGIGFYNVDHDIDAAQSAYHKAFAINSDDGRLLFELDQLDKRACIQPTDRLKRLQSHPQLVVARDDLSLELATLYNITGEHQKAMDLLISREFRPWEGGEGKVLAQYEYACLLLGDKALRDEKPTLACKYYRSALESPANLGEARHLLAADAHIRTSLGIALHAAGHEDEACEQWETVAASSGDFTEMAVREHSVMTYYKSISLAKLGRHSESKILLHELNHYGQRLLETPANIDYFATSLPLLLVFDDDPNIRQKIEAHYLIGIAHLGLSHYTDGLTTHMSISQKQFIKVLELDPTHQGTHRQMFSKMITS